MYHRVMSFVALYVLAMGIGLSLVTAHLSGSGGRGSAPRPRPHPVLTAATALVSGQPAGVVGVDSLYTPTGSLSVLRTEGTGFVVPAPTSTDPGRVLVATAAHVIGPASTSMRTIAVHVAGSRTAIAVASIVAYSRRWDLALLSVPGLQGVTPLQLDTRDSVNSATATGIAEVDCVRGPSWAYQSFALSLLANAAQTSDGREGTDVTTQTVGALPGCSGGPITMYMRSGDTFSGAVIGIVTAISTQPLGIVFIPASSIAHVIARDAS